MQCTNCRIMKQEILLQKNEVFMDYLQHGIPVRYTAGEEQCSSLAYIVDYKNIDNNSFIIANPVDIC